MRAKQPEFDRTEEDLGNIVGLEHLNLLIPDQQTMLFVKKS